MTCPVCTASTTPRPDPTPGRWAPASLGALSIFVDPVFITTIFAMKRAGTWLRWARDREYGPWHTYVRSNAVWGTALAMMQPILIFLLFGIAAFIGRTMEPAPPSAAQPHDERAEIMAMVRSDLADIRMVGICQLAEIGPQAGERPHIEAILEDHELLSHGCAHLCLARLDDVPIGERYRRLSVGVRDSLLEFLAERDFELANGLAQLEEGLAPRAERGLAALEGLR